MKLIKNALKSMVTFLIIFVTGMICGAGLICCTGIVDLKELNTISDEKDHMYAKPEPTAPCKFKKGDKVVYVTGSRDDYGGIVSRIKDGKVYINWRIKFSYFLETYDKVYDISGIWMYLDLPEYMECSNERLMIVDDSTW